MPVLHRIKQASRSIWVPFFRITHQHKPNFNCPICGYEGAFLDIRRSTGARKNAECPNCFSLERHRIQHLVVQSVLSSKDLSKMKMLHFAPEPFFQAFFSERFGIYETADRSMRGVTHHVDIQALPFADQSYDFVFASHVMEHIPDDKKAVSEIRRILKPGGIAILPVPIVGSETIEYPAPNPHEEEHVRAPGFDYYDRYQPFFSKVEQYTSESFPSEFQLFVYEDRTQYSKEKFPLRQPMQGERHIDIVPVCYV